MRDNLEHSCCLAVSKGGTGPKKKPQPGVKEGGVGVWTTITLTTAEVRGKPGNPNVRNRTGNKAQHSQGKKIQKRN